MKTKQLIPLVSLLSLAWLAGCNKNSEMPFGPKSGASSKQDQSDRRFSLNYQQVNLVADTPGLGGGRIDPKLGNAWGIAMSSSGAFWISANHTGSAVIYDQHGVQRRPPVSINLHGQKNGASPDGVVTNETNDFFIHATSENSHFIFATEDGLLAAWGSGDSAVTVVDRSATGAVYKGIAMGNVHGQNYLYVTNFNAAKIEVFNTHYNLESGFAFTDPTLPAGYAPFNIRLIDGKLYVTYALQKPDKHDDQAGPGNGFVDVFETDGAFVNRFASKGTLNSPWGIEEAPAAFGSGKETILVGNFGDGRINVFGTNGAFEGQLSEHGNPITIDGLWGLTFAGNKEGAGFGNPPFLFFTAGPDDENHGLFGYLEKR